MRGIAWLALPLELLHLTAAADPVAKHILHAISSEDGTASAETNASSSTPPESIATGSGPAFASSCQAALWSWKEASDSYGSKHLHPTTTTKAGSVYATYTYTNFTGGVKATKLATLCDGYPRAVGSASYENVEVTTISFTPYAVPTTVPASFTTPMPCSIGPSDCSALWKSFASSTSASLVFENQSVLEPPCQTDPANATVPFETASCAAHTYGPGPGIIGSEVRLLYWPVRTASSSDAYFCSSYNKDTIVPTYLPGTPTASGPNTFVTGDLTITSPTVAISFSGLHRLDGCGTTLDHTILPLPASQLSSVRGARAAYAWYPFNLADLNWKCESPNGTFTIQDTNKTTDGAECYQDVAAQAYWGAAPQVDYARGAANTHYPGLTIVNDYRPYVIPDQNVGTELLHSLWGTSATWWIDGIWDPPIALTEANHEAVPTLPGGGGDAPTTTSADTILTTPAMTAHTTPTEVVPTALSEVVPTYSAASSADSKPTSNTAQEPSQSVHLPDSPADTDTPPVMVSNEVSWGSQTLTVGGAAQTVGSQVVSADQAGLVVNVESGSKTTIPYSTPSHETTTDEAGGMATSPTASASDGVDGSGSGSSNVGGEASSTTPASATQDSAAQRKQASSWFGLVMAVIFVVFS